MRPTTPPAADSPRRFQHPVLPAPGYPAPGTAAWILAEARIRAMRRVREAEEQAAARRDSARREAARRHDLFGSGVVPRLVIRRRYGCRIVMTQEGLTIEAIARAVARYHGLRLADLTGPGKARSLAWPRQEVMFIAREAGFTWPAIARALGGRDHTTVIDGYHKVEARLASHPPTLDAVTVVRLRLAGAS